MKKQIGIGIIGCGNISSQYFEGCLHYENLKLVACADLRMEAAGAQAEAYGCQALTVTDLLAHTEIELVINLTLPAVHAEVSLDILNAGKHVHVEKPLCATLEEAREVMDLAEAKGLRVGCAPDTFLGNGLQTCRSVISQGWIGEVISGTAFMMCGGHESWHPNPAFYYQKGGGPLFDMGPYYLTALVHLLGPVRSVTGKTSRTRDTRMATSKDRFGDIFNVEVPTHYAGTLEFHSGALITLVQSFDVPAHRHHPIELYGTRGSLGVPDPNTFGGPVSLWTPESKAWKELPLLQSTRVCKRGIGPADLASTLLSNGEDPHRSSGQLGFHVLEVMHAFERAAECGQHQVIESKPGQPAPLTPDRILANPTRD